MKKYYLMAIDGGDSDGMYNLGYYYHFVEENYSEMKKYYLMAIEEDNMNARSRLQEYENKRIDDFINNLEISDNKKYEISNRTEQCLICKEENKFTVNIKCNQNGKIYDHYYCSDCMKSWYKNNRKYCLICNIPIDIDNAIVTIKQ